jgi:hypothetical protein
MTIEWLIIGIQDHTWKFWGFLAPTIKGKYLLGPNSW